MTEIEELTLQANELLNQLKSLPVFQRYKELKKALENDEYLTKLKDDCERLQASIKHLTKEKQQEAIKACQEMQNEYNNSPLVVNFLSSKEEVLKLIEPLTETKL